MYSAPPPAAAAAAAADALNLPSITACKPRTSCVSTASWASPSQYLPPWSFTPDAPDAAARTLLRVLEDAGAAGASVREAEGSAYVQADLPVAGRPGEVDRVTVVLRPDGIALFSAQGSVNRLPPPFCYTPGCISGPAQRGTLARLQGALGWAALEADGGEDAKWVQILLHN